MPHDRLLPKGAPGGFRPTFNRFEIALCVGECGLECKIHC